MSPLGDDRTEMSDNPFRAFEPDRPGSAAADDTAARIQALLSEHGLTDEPRLAGFLQDLAATGQEVPPPAAALRLIVGRRAGRARSSRRRMLMSGAAAAIALAVLSGAAQATDLVPGHLPRPADHHQQPIESSSGSRPAGSRTRLASSHPSSQPASASYPVGPLLPNPESSEPANPGATTDSGDPGPESSAAPSRSARISPSPSHEPEDSGDAHPTRSAEPTPSGSASKHD